MLPPFLALSQCLRLHSSRSEDRLSPMDAPVSAKAALLQALISGPGFGLDLIERVKVRTAGRLVLGEGSVYPALRAMEREGLLEGFDGESAPERGGRPRRYYRLTALGAKAATEHRDTALCLFQPERAAR